MKVKELIKELGKLDQNEEIYLNVDEEDVKQMNELAAEKPAILLINIHVPSTSVFGFATVRIERSKE